MTEYLDTPARSLEEVRAEVAASLFALATWPETCRTEQYQLLRHRLHRQLTQIDAEIKARVKP
jgi:hypothetical protein